MFYNEEDNDDSWLDEVAEQEDYPHEGETTTAIADPPEQVVETEKVKVGEQNYDRDQHILALNDIGEEIIGLGSISEVTLEVFHKAVLYAQDKAKWSETDLKRVFDAVTNKGATVFGDSFDITGALLQVRSTDKGYVNLITSLYHTASSRGLPFVYDEIDQPTYQKLTKLMIESLSSSIWYHLEDEVEPNKLGTVQYVNNATISVPSSLAQLGVGTEDHLEVLKNNIAALDTSKLNAVELPKEQQPQTGLFVDSDLTEGELLEIEVKEKSSTVINQIMTVLGQIYRVNFINKPLGVLSSKGVITYNSQKKNFTVIPSIAQVANTIYGVFQQELQENGTPYLREAENPQLELKGDEIFSSNGSLRYNYLPLLHAIYINGLVDLRSGEIERNWASMLQHIRQQITVGVEGLMRYGLQRGWEAHALENSIKELFTNVIFVKELDRKKALNLAYHLAVQGLLKVPRKYYTGLEPSEVIRDNAGVLLGNTLGQTINLSKSKENIVNFLYVYDSDQYTKEILFSYKLYDNFLKSGVKPDLNNIVLGKRLNGEDFGINVAQEDLVTFALVSGSGSGKGVVTMNFAAGVLAAGASVMYADFKPDMAAAFWDLERYLTKKLGRTVPVLSVDGMRDTDRFGNKPIRWYDFSVTVPDYIKNLETFDYAKLRIMPYIKMINLYVLIATYRNENKFKPDGKFIPIFDEIQTFNTMLGDLYDMVDMHSSVNKESNAKKYGAEVVTYMNKLLRLINDLYSGISNVQKTTGRIAGVTSFAIGQRVNPSEWKFGKKGWGDSKVITLITGANFRMVGKGHTSSNTGYSVNQVAFEGSSLIKERGYFAVHSGFATPSDGKDITVLKSYLTLNANDVEKSVPSGDLENIDTKTITGGMLKGFALEDRKNIYHNEFLLEDGSVNHAIGFIGLVEKIISGLYDTDPSEVLADHASRAYVLAKDALAWTGLGHYQDVEQYLYDCSLPSLYTSTELEKQKPLLDAQNSASKEKEEEEVLGVHGEDISVPSFTFGSNNEVDESTKTDEIIEGEYEELSAQNNTETPFNVVNSEEPQSKPLQALVNEEENRGAVELPKPKPLGGLEQPIGGAPFGGNATQQPKTFEAAGNNIYGEALETNDFDYGKVKAYTKQLKVPPELFSRKQRGKQPLSLYTAKQLSVMITSDMVEIAGGERNITSFQIGRGGIYINEVAYRPKLDETVIEKLPELYKDRVRTGDLTDLFYFGDLRRFKNLVSLTVTEYNLAEGKMRDELPLHPTYGWERLFKMLPKLQQLNIAGANVSKDSEGEVTKNTSYEEGYALQNTLADRFSQLFGLSKKAATGSRSFVERKTPLRVVKNASIATIATYGVYTAATLFGGWGLLLGAFAGYGALKERKNQK